MNIGLSKYIVYGLVDPRNDQMFYIGKSCDGTKQMRRHTQPWSLKKANASKNNLIMEILTSGYDGPVYVILDQARSRKEIEMKERIWIARYNDTILNKRIG